MELVAAPGPDGQAPAALFCENETNVARLFGAAAETPYPKDGINDHVISGAATVNPEQAGTKAALHHVLTVAPGETATIELRLREPAAAGPGPGTGTGTGTGGGLGDDFDEVMATREREADAFYAELPPAAASADEALILRQALAGMLWSKQFFHFDVRRWLQG